MKTLQLLALLAFFKGVCSVPIAISEVQEKSAQGLRLLQLGEDLEPVWKTEDEKLELMKQRVNFFDITETYELEQSLPAVASKAIAATYSPPSHQSAVTPLLSKLSTTQQQSWLSTLSAFNNRYYKSSTGADASAWIQTTVRNLASAAGRSDVHVSAFSHSWAQSSTIVKFDAATSNGPITILGGHMDSINLSNPTSGRAPGSDDDGTGTVNLLDALRVLIQTGFKPSTPLEFHFYSGEEGGLLGSNAIATSYKSAGKSVKAMLQFDMTGYVKPGSTEVIGLITDNVDTGLNTFITQLASAYAKIPVATTRCGYACSDHASWTKQGYPSSFPFESLFGNDNPNIHSSGDTTSVSGFSWSHALEFTKLALGFAYELSV
jgi:leucyl aminopeptidase